MNVQLLHYRSWQGSLRRPLWSIWPIARVSLALLLRRRLFWGLYAFGLLFFLMFFFGSFLLNWAQTQIPTTPIQIGRLRTDPDRLLRVFRQALNVLSGSQETFAHFFSFQGSMVVVMLSLAGAQMVGNDYTCRSLPFYLAKPLSRWHYLLGKGLAVAMVVHLLTTLPALLLFAQHSMDDWEYLTRVDFFVYYELGKGPSGWLLLAGILGYGCLLSVFLSILLVAIASWVRRTLPLIMVWTALFFFLRMLASILVDVLKYDARWRLLDLWNNLGLLGRAMLGFDHQQLGFRPQPSLMEASLVLAGVCIICLSFLNLRTRAVEIVA